MLFNYRAVLFCLGMTLVFKGKLKAACTPAPSSSNPGLSTAATPTTKLPFCPVTGTLAQAMKVIACKQKEKKGKTFAKERRRRGTITWPYNCAHAALTYDRGMLVVEVETHECCEVCRFPNFTTCVASGTSDVETRCLEEGVQCIENCIKTHLRDCGPQLLVEASAVQTRIQLATGAPQPRILRPRLNKGRCATRTKQVEGSFCLERSCIPVDI